MSAGRIAILIDAGFFLKRLPKLVGSHRCDSPGKIVACLRRLCRRHIKTLTGDEGSRWHQHVYRIFFYDAVPYDGKAHHPVDNRIIEFAKSDIARQRHALFELLRKERKVALRLGKVTREHDWAIQPAITKKLLKTRQWARALEGLEILPPDAGNVTLELSPDQARSLIELRDLWHTLDGSNVRLGLRQKGVDMRHRHRHFVAHPQEAGRHHHPRVRRQRFCSCRQAGPPRGHRIHPRPLVATDQRGSVRAHRWPAVRPAPSGQRDESGCTSNARC